MVIYPIGMVIYPIGMVIYPIGMVIYPIGMVISLWLFTYKFYYNSKKGEQNPTNRF